MLPTKGIEIGKAAPSWELKDLEGRLVKSEKFRGKPLLIFFFRGTWCPSCRKQMKQISEFWPRIKSLANVIGIVGEEGNYVQNFCFQNELPFPLIPDPGRSVIEQHNLYQPFALNGFRLARPTTLIIDQKGLVSYCYVGSSQFDRPDLENVFQELARL